MVTQLAESITAVDDTRCDATLFLPDAGSGPGILLLHEIFGLTRFVRAKAAALAERGYVVLCPDVFYRTQRNTMHALDTAGLEAARALVNRWSSEVSEATAIGDLLGALAHLRSLRSVTDTTAAVAGWCLGGRLAYAVAVAGHPNACVSYYGSGIGARVQATASSVTCPVLFHYGTADSYISADEVSAVELAFAGRDDVHVHRYEGAGHAFENFEAPMFHDPEAADRSWAITTAWLDAYLRPSFR